MDIGFDSNLARGYGKVFIRGSMGSPNKNRWAVEKVRAVLLKDKKYVCTLKSIVFTVHLHVFFVVCDITEKKIPPQYSHRFYKNFLGIF